MELWLSATPPLTPLPAAAPLYRSDVDPRCVTGFIDGLLPAPDTSTESFELTSLLGWLGVDIQLIVLAELAPDDLLALSSTCKELQSVP